MSTAPARRRARVVREPKGAVGTGPGRARQRLRTRRDLLTAAVPLIARGSRPTVAELADAAGVSRRTAYRYFPTQAKLFAEAALESVRPQVDIILRDASADTEGAALEDRADRFLAAVQQLVVEHEPLLRSLVAATVLEPPGTAIPRRGARRIQWIEDALRPARGALPRAMFERLVSAFTVCAGIEPMMALRDIRGLSPAAAVDVSRWMARAVLRQALAEAQDARRRRHERRPQ